MKQGKNMLELFAGTHSVGEVMKENGYNVVSLDITDYNGKHVPTHKCDILTWDYKQYDKDFFEVVWASPPCIFYSKLQDCWIGRMKKSGLYTVERHEEDLALANSWVLKAIEIIEYFNPKYWFIENPDNGKLKNMEFMQFLPYHTIDYCMYSDWGYRKRTRIWTNVPNFNPQVCNRNCGNLITINERTFHFKNCGNSMSAKLIRDHCNTNNFKKIGGCTSKLERYRVPPNLVKSLMSF